MVNQNQVVGGVYAEAVLDTSGFEAGSKMVQSEINKLIRANQRMGVENRKLAITVRENRAAIRGSC